MFFSYHKRKENYGIWFPNRPIIVKHQQPKKRKKKQSVGFFFNGLWIPIGSWIGSEAQKPLDSSSTTTQYSFNSKTLVSRFRS